MIGKGLTAKKIQHFTSSAYKDNKDISGIGKYTLDNSLSTDEVKVFVNTTAKKVVVSNRGTKGMVDWLNNVALISGKYDITPRYNRAKAVQEKVLKKYKGYEIINVGHSQSGAITKRLNEEKMTNEIINVNPAIMPSDRKKKNETTIRSTGDVVSMFHTKNGKDVIIDAKTNNPLTEHKTEILERLNPKMVIGLGFTESYFNFQ